MRKLGPFSLEGVVLITCAVMLLLGVTTCNARRDGVRQERVRQAEANAYKASLAGLAARRSTDSLVVANRIAERSLIASVASNRKVMLRLSETLAANDALLASDSADVPTLRLALQRTTEVARLFRDSTEVILSGVGILVSAHEAERGAWMAERAANAATISAKNKLIRELRESGQVCRIVLVPCPSRVQSLGIGAGIVLILLL